MPKRSHESGILLQKEDEDTINAVTQRAFSLGLWLNQAAALRILIHSSPAVALTRDHFLTVLNRPGEARNLGLRLYDRDQKHLDAVRARALDHFKLRITQLDAIRALFVAAVPARLSLHDMTRTLEQYRATAAMARRAKEK